MATSALPRFWPPQHWAARQRLADPAEALWSELRIARGAIDVVELTIRAIEHCEDAFAIRGDAFRRFDQLLDDWVARGLVTVTGHPARYDLVREYQHLRSPPPPPAPRALPFPKRTQQQRLWTAMKVLRTFDLPTLLMAADANRRAALDMVRTLERGGWLRATANGWTTTAARKWGPVVPLMRRQIVSGVSVMRVTDRLTGAIVDFPARSYAARARGQDNSSNSLADGG
ncbi:hypothetical protein [Sphingopyxis sp. FD7]|uniref:hypothetical protein n=1 Tax=Sphingopyxis sp. FD7 TaxID=1914525 RepID=UPI000DC626EE|nr:hypothetical protein [Sphingopyxis sp. FD7]BBB13443.1 hypothetical protein SPYCA_2701 [Sphingopyxis sp. FD7]